MELVHPQEQMPAVDQHPVDLPDKLPDRILRHLSQGAARLSAPLSLVAIVQLIQDPAVLRIKKRGGYTAAGQHAHHRDAVHRLPCVERQARRELNRFGGHVAYGRIDYTRTQRAA